MEICAFHYVIAVNMLDDFANKVTGENALFGKSWEVGRWENGKSINRRVHDGVWTPTKNTRLSAALLFYRLTPGTLGWADVRFYHNPWANIKYESVLTRLPQGFLKKCLLEKRDGESLKAILGLPEDWPGA